MSHHTSVVSEAGELWFLVYYGLPRETLSQYVENKILEEELLVRPGSPEPK